MYTVYRMSLKSDSTCAYLYMYMCLSVHVHVPISVHVHVVCVYCVCSDGALSAHSVCIACVWSLPFLVPSLLSLLQYHEMSYGLNVEMHKQTEIAKRLNAICAQVIPFLSQEVRMLTSKPSLWLFFVLFAYSANSFVLVFHTCTIQM